MKAITEATPDAVSYVLSNLWERGQQELDLIGVPIPMAAEIIETFRGQGMPTMAMHFNGVPVFIAGLAYTSPEVMNTWFQATEEFTAHAREITVALRKRIEEVAKERRLTEIEIMSPCLHPKTGKWFAALGFSLDLDYYLTTNGGQRLYRFTRSFTPESDDVLLQA